MRYLKDCSECDGKGFEEFHHGLLQVGCEECEGTGKIAKAIPEVKPGQYFCCRCEKPHGETSRLGIKHLEFQAEEEPDDDTNLSGIGLDNQSTGSDDTSEP